MSGVWKWLSMHKTCSISETLQNRAKVTVNCVYKVPYDLSFGGKMCDFE